MIWFPPGIVAAAGAGAPSFQPDDIASLEMWFDLSDLTTITDISGEITDLTDKGPNGWDLDQTNAAERPNTDTINGNAGAFFDGGDVLQNLSVGSPAVSLGESTLACVFTPDSVSPTDVIVATRDSGFARVVTISQTGAGVQGANHEDFFNITSELTAGTTAWAIFRFQDGSQDGLTDKGSTVSDTVATLDTANIDDIILGGLAPTGDFVGHIHEFMIFSTFITGTERTNLANYFDSKWTT